MAWLAATPVLERHPGLGTTSQGPRRGGRRPWAEREPAMSRQAYNYNLYGGLLAVSTGCYLLH